MTILKIPVLCVSKSCPLLLDFLYLLSSEKSGLLNDESDNNWSDSRSYGTCDFPLHYYEHVGHVSVLGSGVFVPIGVESKCDVFAFVVFVSI